MSALARAGRLALVFAAGVPMFGVLLLGAQGIGLSAQLRPQPAEALIALINAYRDSSRFCQGKTMLAVGPLAPDAALANIPLAHGTDLNAALKQSGYRAARAQAIVLSGPRNAAAAMSFLRTKYCETVMSAQFSQIGVSRDGSSWRLVLAQPLLSADLGDWRTSGREILQLANAARAVPRACGERNFPAAPPLSWDARLAAAALAHSQEMARRNYFSHTGKDGARVGERASRAGYDWQGIGENIATGQASPARAVAGWLASPSHCTNLMSSAFTQMGAAYAVNLESDTGIYWAQVLAAPR
ncbi:MAG: CAP domain-containing protein [Burkholderiales bacterium]